MDLWDRLCCILRARIVSVEDVSNKVIHGLCNTRSALSDAPMSIASLKVHAYTVTPPHYEHNSAAAQGQDAALFLYSCSVLPALSWLKAW